MRLRPGDPAPDFSGITGDGRQVRLADYRGRKLVLYFYPMDDTPHCTAQACSLRDAQQAINARDASILGISPQSGETHRRFAEKHALDFPLLADTEQRIARAYNAISPAASWFSMGLLRMNRRITYVIDETGRIEHVIDDPDPYNHGRQVIDLL